MLGRLNFAGSKYRLPVLACTSRRSMLTSICRPCSADFAAPENGWLRVWEQPEGNHKARRKPRLPVRTENWADVPPETEKPEEPRVPRETFVALRRISPLRDLRPRRAFPRPRLGVDDDVPGWL